MLRCRVFGVEFTFRFLFFAVLALFLLAEEGALVFYLLLPVAVHELGHFLVMALCRVGIRGVDFTPTGIHIQRRGGAALGYGKELAVCLGGAAANLLFAAYLHFFCFQSMRVMLLVAVNLAVALFNLAPIGDLDGGQIVSLLTHRFFGPGPARAVSKGASVVLLAALFALSFFAIFRGIGNLSLLIACGYLAAGVIRQD